MLLKITRGLGGSKGRLILVITAALGVILVVGAIWFRYHLLKPKGVAATALPAAQIVVLGDNARGSSLQVAFVPGDFARTSSSATARRLNNQWFALDENTILKVTGTKVTDGETWVTGVVENKSGHPTVTVHASFLERYRPVVLDGTVELSDVKLEIVRDGASPGTGVTGWLRNISGRTITQCLVTCVFQDREEHEVDVRRSTSLELPDGELVRFQTMRADKPFASIAIQIMYATPDGLRNYLSTVVIQKSSL